MKDAPHTGLTLLLGPANSGKMGHVLTWWRERSSLAPLIVAPTVPDARALSLEAARRFGGIIGQSPALTFDGLVRLILGSAPHYAGGVERMLIVSRLLRSALLEALAPAADRPGVATALTLLIQQLGESGRKPEELDHILARWAAEPEGARLAGDVGRLVAGYRNECERRGLIDRPDAVRMATGRVEGWTRPVSFYGFTSFTFGQRDLVQALCRQVELLVTLSHDPSRDVDLMTPDEMAWWRSLASRVVEVSSHTLAYDSPAVAYVERHLMSDAGRPEPPQAYCHPEVAGAGEVWPQGSRSERVRPEGVRFLLSSGRRTEAESAAQEIAGLLRAGFLPGEIAVVVRRTGPWGRLLRHVFGSCGIPYQMDERCALGETGLGHAFLRALEGVALDDAEGVLALLRSPYSGVPPDHVSDLERRYRQGAARGADALRALADSMSLELVARLWTLLEPDGCDPEGHGLRFALHGAEILSGQMLEAGLRGALVGSREAEEDARAYRALQAALAAIAAIGHGDGEESIDPQTVLRVLRSVEVPGGRPGEGDAVQVLSVERARARRFKAVVILGLVEGEFPGRADRVSLLEPAQRARLDALAGGLFGPEPDQEAALFVSAVSRASRVLLLSARDAEDDGGEATPSYFWLSAKQLLGVGEGDHLARTLADQVFSPESAPSVRHYLRGCAAWGTPLHASVKDQWPEDAVLDWGRAPSCLTAPEVLADLESLQCFSPSALESYAACPFKWFVERVIHAEDVESRLDGRVIGQLLHEVLRITYSRLAAESLLPLRAEGMLAAERAADVAVDALVAGEGCPGGAADRRIAAQRLKRMARNLFEMEVAGAGRLVPARTETRVGGDAGVDIGGLRVKGRLDRVDTDPATGELFVLDYKTGALPTAAALGTGEGLQLPLYILALQTDRTDEDVVGGAYLGLSAKERIGVVRAGSCELLGLGAKGVRELDGAGMEELLQKTRETALGAATGMRAGVIAPLPERKCPPWCVLGPACRSKRGGYRS